MTFGRWKKRYVGIWCQNWDRLTKRVFAHHQPRSRKAAAPAMDRLLHQFRTRRSSHVGRVAMAWARQLQLRGFRASSVAMARRGRRAGRLLRGVNAQPKETNAMAELASARGDFAAGDANEDDGRWEVVGGDASDADDDNDEEQDEETKEFMKGLESFLALDEDTIMRRLNKLDLASGDVLREKRRAQRTGREIADMDVREDTEAQYEEDDADKDLEEELEDDDIERAERIPKRRLMRVLDEFGASKSHQDRASKSAAALPHPKLTKPLEKKPKKPINRERISYRQEKVETNVMHFVQNLLLQNWQMADSDVYPSIVEAAASDGLRRIVLYWEPTRRNALDQKIAKRKAEGVERQLARMEKRIRAQVTAWLNFKYSPMLVFRRRKQQTSPSNEHRELLENELAWLEQFKGE